MHRGSVADLGVTASSGIVLVLLEVTAVKLLFYLLQGSRASFLDLLSCSGYKFIGFVLTLSCRLIFGTATSYAALAASSTALQAERRVYSIP